MSRPCIFCLLCALQLEVVSHYCDVTKNDKTYLTWDNNLEEANVEDGAIALECLEAGLFGVHDGDQIHTSEMPPPTTSRFPDAGVLPLASQRPIIRGGHSSSSRVPRSLPAAPIPPRTREKKLEVSRGKRKT